MENNLFQDIPEQSKEEIFTALFENKNILIERIVSFGQTSPEDFWYDQKKDEWVIVIQGSAEISFSEKETISLKTGDHLFIPAHKKHRVTRTENKTIWLAVHV